MKIKAKRRETKRYNKRKTKVSGASAKKLHKLKFELPEKFYSR